MENSPQEIFNSLISSKIYSGFNAEAGGLIIRHGLWEYALELCADTDSKISFRAAWALDWAYFNDKQPLLPHFGELLHVVSVTVNSSVIRELNKIVCDVVCNNPGLLTEEQKGLLIERNFDLLIDPAAPPAVKVWCMEILYCLSETEEWIKEELRQIALSFFEDQTHASTSNRALKIIKRYAADTSKH